MSMSEYQRLVRKLDNPPAAINLVRFASESPHKVARSMVKFVMGIPQHTYVSGGKAIKDRIELGIDLATAVKMVMRSGTVVGRPLNETYVIPKVICTDPHVPSLACQLILSFWVPR